MATEKNSEEMYFEWWCEELKANGLIHDYEREPKAFVLVEAVPIFYNQKKITTSIVKSFELFKQLTYTADYKVRFKKEMLNKLFGFVDSEAKELSDDGYHEIGSVYQNTLFYTTEGPDENGLYTLWFDVKPTATAIQFSGRLGSSRDFKYVTRMVFERYNIIVNKVVPIGNKACLFGKTFCPKRYRYTDVTMKPRKLKEYELGFKNLDQYLETKKIIKP